MNADLPSFTSSSSASSTYGMTDTGLMAMNAMNQQNFAGGLGGNALSGNAAGFLAQAREFKELNQPQPQAKPAKLKETVAMSATRRLVQVFIADPNENIPLDQCVLYSGDQKLTDATDQELFFEIDIKGVLEKHNENRVKLVDKKVKERVEHLDPAKVRDLKMVVVTVAQF